VYVPSAGWHHDTAVIIIEKTMKSESKIQSKLIKNLEDEGYYVIRLIKTNKDGILDLLALKDKCKPVFIEVKKEKGGVLSPVQRFRIKELKERGFEAYATACSDYPPHYCTKEIVCNQQCDKCKEEIDEIYGF